MVRRPAGLFWLGVLLVLVGGLIASLTQTAGRTIAVRDVRFMGANGNQLSALLYIPRGVTAAKPAPGILAVHGYINSREVQTDFAIEFARRGYVVLSMDQAGHGYSDAPAFANGFGGPAGLAYLRSLDVVDKNNIGLEGHSMGGWTILNAAAAFPDGYRSMVLEGSSTGSGFAPEGTPTAPRNLGLVYSRYDEFSVLMWNVARAQDVTGSDKLKKVFGTTETITPGRMYGDVAAGTARMLFTPATTHPGDHLSRAAIGDAVRWFQQTLTGGTPLPASNQIWPWKEFGTTLGWIGFVLLVLGTGGLLLNTRTFASLNRVPGEPRGMVGGAWWVGALLMLAIPVFTYFPFFHLADRIIKPGWLWPQTITNEIMLWAVLNAVISLILFLVWRATSRARPSGAADDGRSGPEDRTGPEVGKAALLALASVGVGYLSLALTDFFFKVDYRFWFVGLKLMNTGQFRMFLSYLIPFTLYTLMAATVLHSQMRRSRRDNMLVNVALMAGGFLLFLLVEYGTLFARGALFSAGEPLNVIVAIQFLPILALLGIFMSYFARHTGRIYAGAFVASLFVTWYIVAGQATQVPL
ncbi:alpha/beta hydrolase family protein [Deinococcus sonorensis]|uniref:Alpha/beta fold hydrolase n=1 Tax=Deinococcus sonorensis KR-87 TaxID=694439 RepID=A0AAU7UFX5_9DEIO